MGAIGLPLAEQLGYDAVLMLGLGLHMLMMGVVPLLWRRVSGRRP